MATVCSVLSSVVFDVCDVVLWWVSMAAMKRVVWRSHMSAGSHSVREKWTSSWSGGLPKQTLGKATLFLFSRAPWFPPSEIKKVQVMEKMMHLSEVSVVVRKAQGGPVEVFFSASRVADNGVVAEVRFAVPETSVSRRALCGEDVTCSGGSEEVVEKSPGTGQ